MSRWRLTSVLRGLRNLRRMERDKSKRAFIDAMIDDQQIGIQGVDGQIFAAKMIEVRNPAFDGDMIGYPEDDFDEQQDEDEGSDEG